MAPFSLVSGYQYFFETCCRHLQYTSTLKMELAAFFETSIPVRLTARCHIAIWVISFYVFCCSLKNVGKLPPSAGTVIVRTNPPPSQGSANRVSVNSNQNSSLQPKSAAMNGTGDSLRLVAVCAYSKSWFGKLMTSLPHCRLMRTKRYVGNVRHQFMFCGEWMSGLKQLVQDRLILKMEALWSSETSVNVYHSTR
jgi:hypothetical protein